MKFLYCITSAVPSRLPNQARISRTMEYYLVAKGEKGSKTLQTHACNFPSVGKMVKLLHFCFSANVEMVFYRLGNLLAH